MGSAKAELEAAASVLVGDWRTEATHRAFPGLIVRGTTRFEALGTGGFLVMRSETDHPDFPDAVSVIGDTGGLRMHYFDDRGVHRIYEVQLNAESFSYSLIRRGSGTEFAAGDPGFWQRFTGRFADNGNRIDGMAQMSKDNVVWEDDLGITFWRTRS
jgi:hypothetical protein